MKSRYYLLMLTIAIITLSVSCKKALDSEPQTQISQEDLFSNLSDIQLLVGGLYNNWRDVRKDRGGFMFELGSDEAQQGAFQVMTDGDQAGLDKYDGFMAPANNALTAQWDSRWPIVNGAAQSIYALQNNTGDPAVRDELLGEASFIRAAVMFELTQYWGEIPVLDPARAAEFGLHRQPLDTVYRYITSDLQYAADHLPEEQSDKRKVSKYAALALLGKVYLYAPTTSSYRDYQKAADNFKQVISSGKFSLLPNYADVFSPDHANSSESIYEYQFNNVYPDNNQTQWQMGSRALANYDANCYFGGYDLMVPTKYCYSAIDSGGVWEPGDTRRDASIRYDFTYKGVTPPILTGFGGDELDPHVKKFEDPRTDGTLSFWYSGKDIFYLRYSDVLLCYAECLNELNKTSDAVNIANEVRDRAFGGSTPVNLKWSNAMSQDEFRTKILDERMRELCFEGWRRMDLLRTGKFVELVKARNKWTAQSNTIQAFNQLYPIPITEMQTNSDLTTSDQNPGY